MPSGRHLSSAFIVMGGESVSCCRALHVCAPCQRTTPVILDARTFVAAVSSVQLEVSAPCACTLLQCSTNR